MNLFRSRLAVQDAVAAPGAAPTADRSAWAMDSLAAATASLTISLAAPLLSHYGIGSRPARIADVESGWFGYWSREMGVAPVAAPESWSPIVALQALYEGGALETGKAIDLHEGPPKLADYLRSIGLTVSGAEVPFAHVDLSGTLPARIDVGSTSLGVWLVDLALEGEAQDALHPDDIQSFAQDCTSAGWAVGTIDFALGAHPLDRFVAADTQPADTRTPTLRRMREGAIVTPFIVIARRGG